jgi:hypothetical protein
MATQSALSEDQANGYMEFEQNMPQLPPLDEQTDISDESVVLTRKQQLRARRGQRTRRMAPSKRPQQFRSTASSSDSGSDVESSVKTLRSTQRHSVSLTPPPVDTSNPNLESDATQCDNVKLTPPPIEEQENVQQSAKFLIISELLIKQRSKTVFKKLRLPFWTSAARRQTVLTKHFQASDDKSGFLKAMIKVLKFPQSPEAPSIRTPVDREAGFMFDLNTANLRGCMDYLYLDNLNMQRLAPLLNMPVVSDAEALPAAVMNNIFHQFCNTVDKTEVAKKLGFSVRFLSAMFERASCLDRLAMLNEVAKLQEQTVTNDVIEDGPVYPEEVVEEVPMAELPDDGDADNEDGNEDESADCHRPVRLPAAIPHISQLPREQLETLAEEMGSKTSMRFARLSITKARNIIYGELFSLLAFQLTVEQIGTILLPKYNIDQRREHVRKRGQLKGYFKAAPDKDAILDDIQTVLNTARPPPTATLLPIPNLNNMNLAELKLATAQYGLIVAGTHLSRYKSAILLHLFDQNLHLLTDDHITKVFLPKYGIKKHNAKLRNRTQMKGHFKRASEEVRLQMLQDLHDQIDGPPETDTDGPRDRRQMVETKCEGFKAQPVVRSEALDVQLLPPEQCAKILIPLRQAKRRQFHNRFRVKSANNVLLPAGGPQDDGRPADLLCNSENLHADDAVELITTLSQSLQLTDDPMETETDHVENPLHVAGRKVHAELRALQLSECRLCKERGFDMQVGPRIRMCKRCQEEKNRLKGVPPTYSTQNNMDPGPLPDCLRILTPIEVSAISRVSPCQNIIVMGRGHTYGQKGHSVSFEQDVEGFAKSLPRGQEDLPYVLIKSPSQTTTFRANRINMLAALKWLIRNNPYYADVTIDHETLATYPDNSDTPLTGIRCLNTLQDVTAEQLSQYRDVVEEDEDAPPDPQDIVPSMSAAKVPEQKVRAFLKAAILNENKSADNTLKWPDRADTPTSEWSDGFYSMAFPCLFPYGQADITTPDRPGKIPSYINWLRHLTRYVDGRFTANHRFVLFAVNAYRRRQAITISNVFAKRCCEQLTIGQVKEKVAADDETTIKGLMYFAKEIQGTRAHFKYESAKSISFERFTRIDTDNIGALNLFLTFSLSDLHMPEMHRLLPGSEAYLGKIVVKKESDIPADADRTDYITKQEDFKLRRTALQRNGHIVNFFGNKRLQLVIEHVLCRTLGVTHWFVRNEFQSRGTLHWHMVAYMNGLDAVAARKAFKTYRFDMVSTDQQNFEEDEEFHRIMAKYPAVTPAEQADIEQARLDVATFATDHVGLSEVHPQPDPKLWPPPEGQAAEEPATNCLRLDNLDKVRSDEFLANDLELLTNRVQLHKCTRNYCLKLVPILNQFICRFHFPKDPEGFEYRTEETLPGVHVIDEILLEANQSAGGIVEGSKLRLLRTHPRQVGCIPEILQIWRGNTDQRLVESIKAVREYILKYVLKSEKNSASFDEIVRVLTEDAPAELPVRKLFQKILMKTVAEHDLGLNESFKIISGDSLVEYSNSFAYIGLTDTRMLQVDNNNEDAPATKKNIADLYWARETDANYQHFVENWSAEMYDKNPADVSLYQYASHFNPRWKVLERHKVPHATPNFKYTPALEETKWREVWCRQMLLLHKPATCPTTYMQPYETAEEALAAFVEKDARCPPAIRDDYAESLKRHSGIPDEDVQQLVESEDSDAADYGQDEESRALGTVMMHKPLTNDDIEESDGSEIGDDELGNLVESLVDWGADRVLLGLDNIRVKSVMDNWLADAKVNTSLPPETVDHIEVENLNPAQRRVYDTVRQALITGEQQLIDVSGAAGTGKSHVIKALVQCANKEVGKEGVVRVTAPTGSAASLLPGGRTIHSLLRIRPEDGFAKHEIELTGIGLHVLQTVFENTKVLILDEKSMCGLGRLSQIHRRLCQAKVCNDPFGGITMVLVGDVRQLPPVSDLPLYSPKGGQLAQREGRDLFKDFNVSIELTVSVRQKGDPVFADQLERLGNGTFSMEDWKLWSARGMDNLPADERDIFNREATKLCSRRDATKSFNIRQMKLTKGEIFRVYAINSPGAASADSNEAKGLAKSVVLSRNCRIVLTTNLWTEAKLVNGSRGWIR